VDSVVADWAGISWRLFSEGAVYLETENALIISDPHFGKDASFRTAGIPVPAGTIERDLTRLDGLVGAVQPCRLIILGDFFHNKASRQKQTMELLGNWRGTHSNLAIINIRGNHDKHAGDPPAEWEIEVHSEPWLLSGVALRHHPADTVGRPSICGHVHPAVRMQGRDRSAITVPCFWIGRNQMVLPAFGGFTGKSRISPVSGDRIFVIGQEQIFEVPRIK
jgi:uncharacterized protein